MHISIMQRTLPDPLASYHTRVSNPLPLIPALSHAPRPSTHCSLIRRPGFPLFLFCTQVIISSAFESSCGVSVLTQLAAALGSPPSPQDTSHGQGGSRVAHGLGTLSWFGSDVTPRSLEIRGAPASAPPMAYSAGVEEAAALLASLSQAEAQSHAEPLVPILLSLRPYVQPLSGTQYCLGGLQLPPVQPKAISIDGSSVTPPESSRAPPGSSGTPPALASHSAATTFVFLHGFLGTCEDWVPLMHALSQAGHTTLALDLPGHGSTTVITPATLLATNSGNGNGGCGCAAGAAYSIEAVADAVAAAVAELPGMWGDCVLVGYSMGAREALAAAARHPGMAASLVLVSGSAGIQASPGSIVCIQAMQCVQASPRHLY